MNLIEDASICESEAVGKRYEKEGSQYVKLGANCWTFGAILHELMHVLGKEYKEYIIIAVASSWIYNGGMQIVSILRYHARR